MKIGILIDRLNVGGVEKIAIEEVKALRKLGEDAYLVVLREKAVVANAFPDLLKGVPIVYLDRRLPKMFRLSFRFPVFHFFSSFHLTYPLFLPFVVQHQEFDHFIVHGTYTALSAVAIKKRRDIKFAAFVWDPASYIVGRVYAGKFPVPLLWALKQAAAALDRYLIRNMSVVLVGGSAHNTFIRKVDPNKVIKTVYPSVHTLARLVDKDNYALVVTAWKRGKNPEYLFEVAQALPDVHIKMVGKWLDSLYEQEFKQAVHNRHLERQIEVVGEVNEQELVYVYAHARALLQTNDDRGFGMPALEAAGHGTTFIIPEGQGVCDLFTDKEDGYYVREKDTRAIVALLKPLMEDKKLAVRMGSRAWHKVVRNYSWENHARQLIEVLGGHS